jgi:ABC-type multidrug transport system ATPase subunit
MQVSYCDVCGNVIKNGSKVFYIVTREMIKEDEKEFKDAMEYLREYNKQYDRLEMKEICEHCKKVYDYFFKMRKEEVKEILEDLEKSFEKQSKEIDNE